MPGVKFKYLNMQSRATFDLDVFNNPIIKVEISSTPDVRDKIAKRFIENLGHASQWCNITPSGDGEYLIWPIKPEELRKQAEYMNAWADEIEKGTKNQPALT